MLFYKTLIELKYKLMLTLKIIMASVAQPIFKTFKDSFGFVIVSSHKKLMFTINLKSPELLDEYVV